MTKDKIKLKLTCRNIVILSGLLTLYIYMIIAIISNIYPFGENAYLESDMYHQYYKFLTFYNESIKNGNISELIYSFKRGLGGGGLLFFFYYLSSPLNLFLLLFNKENIDVGILFLIWIKGCLSAMTCSFMINYLRKGKVDYKTVIFSVIYPFTGFVYLYNINIIWTDSIILLPLLIVAIHNLIKNNSTKYLIILLTALFFSHFYMGYIVGVFLLLYTIGVLYTQDDLNMRIKLKLLLKFLLSAICAGLIFGIGAIPVALELKEFSSASMESITFLTNVSIIDSILNLFIGNFNGVVFGFKESSPYIYSSIIVLIFFIYFLLKSKDAKRKRMFLALVIIYAIALFINPIDIIFHAFDKPTGFKQRYAFIISLIMIIAGTYGFDEYIKNNGKDRLTLISIISTILLVFIIFVFAKLIQFKEFEFRFFIINFVFMATYLIVFLLEKENCKKFKIIIGCTLLIELVVNATIITSNMNQNTLELTRGDYANSTHKLIKEIQEKDDEFYRIGIPSELDYITRSTFNDPLYIGFNSLGEFNSASNKKVAKNIEKLGGETDGNLLYNIDPGLLSNNFLSTKYVLSKEEYDFYEKIHDYKTNKNLNKNKADIYLYRNPYKMNLGFMVNKDVLGVDMNELGFDPFVNQEILIRSMLGNDDMEKLHYKIPPVKIDTSNIRYRKDLDGNYIVEKINQEKEASMKFYYKESDSIGQLVLYERQDVKNKKYYPRVLINNIDFGHITRVPFVNIGKNKSTIELVFADNEEIKDYHIGTFNATYYKVKEIESLLKELNNSPQLEDIQINNNKVSGKINIKDDNDLLFLSIPYYDSWKVYINGEEAEKVPIFDAFIGLELQQGLNNIELVFIPKGIYLGAGITIIGLVMFIIIVKKENAR